METDIIDRSKIELISAYDNKECVLFISEDSLDDILLAIFDVFINGNSISVHSTKGNNHEVFGVLIELKNPRDRLSRSELKGTIFSCLGELCWYLSGSKELSEIEYYLTKYKEYSDDGKTIYGGYGPRILGDQKWPNQLDNIVKLLKSKTFTRQAVIQLFDATDLEHPHNDIPCTNTIQLVIRDNQLHMMVNMRSNDIYRGLPHDIFCFTMLQEIIANKLEVSLGSYKHSVGSLHLYDSDIELVNSHLKVGFYNSMPMPNMPLKDFDNSLKNFLKLEKELKENKNLNLDIDLDEYWIDLLILLKIFSIVKNSDETNNFEKVKTLKEKLNNKNYFIYVEKQIEKLI
ncbi:Thymidylate synthase [Marinomonas spartinae]|uniref:thymidylate synthase n=1 Tax=Marinomonas spartinae TaxID=1792290 RepID=UPI000808E000|nr:thymidylate synthase [Marinomonas spartinae]SBS24905.1 Thymidylate synthase [Marinomonas spartinae]